MTTSRRPLNYNMHRSRGPGWTVFDHQQRQKGGSGPECDVDPYPSISKMASSSPAKSSAKRCGPLKSFTSVVRPSVESPVLVSNCKNRISNNNSCVKQQDIQINAVSHSTPTKMLKETHKWADENLIGDILAAVSNDVEQASILLKEMVSPGSKLEVASLSGPSSSTVSDTCEDIDKCFGEDNLVNNKFSNDAYEMLTSKQLCSVPVEPEWEEDDVYLEHRKDAMRMMRIASQHSRAANNAFLRGDHLSAQHYSFRAREEWMAAEKLNAKAAEEIMHIRNINNDMWKLDLHGLHASEAVSALKGRLLKIENHMVMSHSSSSDRLARLKTDIIQSPSSGCASGLEINKKIKKQEVPQQRPTILHVITGAGNHSRGQAALPTAVRSFLIENGYRFEEARAGVIQVRPKFRSQ